MSTKIGFIIEKNSGEQTEPTLCHTTKGVSKKRACLCEVYFAHIDRSYTYYNDSFDLKVSDLCFVSGKLEGCIGTVVSLCFSFKIKPSDYEKVISVADTQVSGKFVFANNMFASFDRQTLPYKKAITWFAPPENADDYVVSTDDKVYMLNDLHSFDADIEIIRRGHDYFVNNKVCYIELCDKKVRAIVCGTKSYTVEFDYDNGEIKNLVCPCYCTDICKHEIAVMLQLSNLLKCIEKNYKSEFEQSRYLSAITKAKLFEIVIDSKDKGEFNL